tara:strand:+ start:23050 stop:23214 length:165 start_codon:yes stop_codon:yes gene_type:complete
MERWLSGLKRTLGKCVYLRVSWVRIPLSPPIKKGIYPQGKTVSPKLSHKVCKPF